MVLEQPVIIRPYVYQVPCIDIVKKTLLTKDEALYVMAMGLGKTITSAFIVEDRLRSGKRGLYLCHETYILKRVEQEYRKVIGNDIVYKTFYGSEAEGKKDWTADQADMLFASFQSMNNWHNQWFLAFDRDHFDFIVIDESHHSQAPSYKEVIDYFLCKKIAMTATPDRMDLKDIREIFGEEVFNLPLEVGIANGWLANVEYHVLSDGIDNRKLKKICKGVLENGKRVSIKQINETIFISERDRSQRDVVAEFSKIKELSGDKKTLLFCERTIHADNLLPYFEKSGVMHSKKTWKENEAVFTAFESGNLQYVASVNKFNEGKHVPGVEVIVFLRATDSLTVFWQQLGRSLAKIGNKTKVIILDFVSNLERLIMVRDTMLRIKELRDELLVDRPEKEPLDTNPYNVSGEGFDFIFADELVDVMKIIDALRKGFYQTWQEASAVAIGLGIGSRVDYKDKYKQDLRLPSVPEVIYGNDFPGYAVFLGKTPAPEGWITRNALSRSKDIICSEETIEKFVSQFRQTNSDWFGEFWVDGRHESKEYYHPDLIKKIKEEFGEAKRKTAPDGWETANSFKKKKVVQSHESVIKFVESFRSKKPHWFQNFWKAHNEFEHYHPDLVKKINKHFLNPNKAPKGWFTATVLSRSSSVTVAGQTISTFVEQFRSENPQWFKKFLSENNREREYYHPDLVMKIVAEFAKAKKAPIGWLNSYEIWTLSPAFTEKIVINFVEQFRVSNPEWFGQFLNQKKREVEYYHPKLIAKIKKGLVSSTKIPDGWRTIGSLKKDKLPAHDIITNFVESYRITHPQWFRNFWKVNDSYEHLHPELIKKIVENFSPAFEKAPIGWQNAYMLEEQPDFPCRKTITKFVKQFKTAQPTWFKFCLNEESTGHRTSVEHYHPDLVQKIKIHYAKKKKE